MISFQWPCSYLPALILAGCLWRRWGSEQVWFVARRHHWVQTIYTYHTFPQCLTLSGWQGSWVDGGVGGWTARYWSRNSPETKRLFCAATEEMCAFSVFIHSGQQAFAAPFVFPAGSGWFCSAGNSVKFLIGTVTVSDFDFDSALTFRCYYRTGLLCWNISIFAFFSLLSDFSVIVGFIPDMPLHIDS